MRIRTDTLDCLRGLDELAPDLPEANEEELLLSVIETWEEGLHCALLESSMVLAVPCAVGLDETRVTDVLARSS
jgi:hypothetical protein